jgi:hypothetical protein
MIGGYFDQGTEVKPYCVILVRGEAVRGFEGKGPAIPPAYGTGNCGVQREDPLQFQYARITPLQTFSESDQYGCPG